MSSVKGHETHLDTRGADEKVDVAPTVPPKMEKTGTVLGKPWK